MSKTKAKVISLPTSPKIEKGVFMPVGRGGNGWAFATNMEVGDSFMLDFKRYAKHSAYSFKKWASAQFPKHEYESRTMDDGVRVWRTK